MNGNPIHEHVRAVDALMQEVAAVLGKRTFPTAVLTDALLSLYVHNASQAYGHALTAQTMQGIADRLLCLAGESANAALPVTPSSSRH